MPSSGLPKTMEFTSGDIALIPHEKGLVLYKKKKKLISVDLDDGRCIMACFLDFARSLIPGKPKEITGKKLPKTGRHKNQKYAKKN